MSKPKTDAEFDAHAEGYTAATGNPLLRIVAGTPDAYIRVKARWLLHHLHRRPPRAPYEGAIRLLDFGCGTGELMKSLVVEGFKGQIEGCDVSRGMLEEAKRRWKISPPPPLHHIGAEGARLGSGEYDVVVVCNVFHHVQPSERPELYKELARITAPGGRIVVFEHNRAHPVTRWVARVIPYDRDAVLLNAGEVEKALACEGLSSQMRRDVLFFPPLFPFLDGLDRLLAPIHAGTQFIVVAGRPDRVQ
jgi:SAM-dependent methyltransferase